LNDLLGKACLRLERRGELVELQAVYVAPERDPLAMAAFSIPEVNISAWGEKRVELISFTRKQFADPIGGKGSAENWVSSNRRPF